MDSSAPLRSPSSDERLWSKLRDRVDAILEQRKPKDHAGWFLSSIDCGVESDRAKRLREDAQLLIRGLDSVASSLSQLTGTLSAAQQEVSDLAKPSIPKGSKRENQRVEDENQPKAKRHCVSNEPEDRNEATDNEKLEVEEEKSVDVLKSGNLKKAKTLAFSMATKAASLARELKNIKSELSFMQERCTLLEEENRRLRDGLEKGVGAEEDDLVRLQLEALLAEKSRLANENTNLTRENQCLHQLVEYHQLTSNDLSASYEQVIQGMCLDFSSPIQETNEFDDSDTEAPCTPTSNHLRISSSSVGDDAQPE
ncbi:serine/threonine-protein kinase MRCK beta [Dioscorea cayenensis subsp. rotundata]|uniref:Serine/threonine-protein kinase MRCK beta n=1 Tax=Dioscorea cayennensis subsp. rotundata TaxID=55577 RepID=A0AB40CMC9_DIOCR|nr:serine/threonine-protein kinase MRCK beta [Dioscorea cayenensis subsp. rotundata]